MIFAICFVAARYVLVMKKFYFFKYLREILRKRKEYQSSVSLFLIAQCPVLRERDTEQSQHVGPTAHSTHFARAIDRRFHCISHDFFFDLDTLLSYITSSSYLQLVLSGFNSGNHAPAGGNSPNICNSWKDVMKVVHVPSGILCCIYSVGLVDKCRTSEQRKSISHKTGMVFSFSTQLVFHTW